MSFFVCEPYYYAPYIIIYVHYIIYIAFYIYYGFIAFRAYFPNYFIEIIIKFNFAKKYVGKVVRFVE